MTLIQKKMLAILKDGLPHRHIELHACLADELAPLSNIHVHICGLRKHLKAKGQDIICEFRNRSRKWYRQVRILKASRIKSHRGKR